MSAGSLTWSASARRAGQIDERWAAMTAASRTRVQVALFLSSVVIAYHYSLATLLQDLGMDTPLAYLGLVPLISLGLAFTLRQPRREPAIHDRQLDYIIGLPLTIGPILFNQVVSDHIGDLYWVWRLDLLTLPVFVAGLTSLIFGARVLWRQKIAVAYLLLAWPYPYTAVLVRVLNAFTNLTIASTKAVLHLIHVASPVPGSDSSIFRIVHAGQPFEVSVVSACSGVNSVVGFSLVGLAFAAVVQGPRLRKGLWLVGGMALLWVLNIGRLVSIFWAGKEWGQQFAINVLHPVVGLVLFAFGIVLMTLALQPMGLRLGHDPRLVVPAGKPAIQRITPVIAIVAICATTLGVIDAGLKQYDIVANAAGQAKLTSYSLNPAAPAGWRPTFYDSYTWARPYFGSASTWYRFEYHQTAAYATLSSSLPVTSDVINTTNLASFSAFGVQACYQFHGYLLRDATDVTFAGGIKGQALSYSSAHHGNWSMVWWVWPVKSSGATHYERVTLYLQDTSVTKVSSPANPRVTDAVKGILEPNNPRDGQLLTERRFLVQFADGIIAAQQKVTTETASTVTAGLDRLKTAHRPGGLAAGAVSSVPGPGAASGGVPAQVHTMTRAQTLERALRLGYIRTLPASAKRWGLQPTTSTTLARKP